MNKKRRICAFLCAFAIVLASVHSVSAVDLSGSVFFDGGFGLGSGDLSTSDGGEENTPDEPDAEPQEEPDNEEPPLEEEPPEGDDTQEEPPAEDVPSGPTEEQQEQLNELDEQLSQLQEQQSTLQQQIENAQNEREKAELQKNNIDGQLYTTSQQIQLTKQKIDLLQQNIDETEEQIGDLNDEIDTRYEEFKKQIRSSYMSPSYSFLEYVLGSESFTDFSLRVETVTRISKHDQEDIDELEGKIGDLNDLESSLADDMEELESSNGALEDLKSQLNNQSAQAQAYLSDIDAMEQAFLADLEEMQARQKAVQAEIDQIYASLELSDEYMGDGTWAWPVPGYSYISSPYGYRFQGADFHTGMDICGSGSTIYGARIVACGAGTVVKVQNNGSNGYGLFCIIDHGGGYTTLYAHTSSIVVSVGDFVEKGQTIGYVGNSGWVIPGPTEANPTAGSHLHIEFRINGAHQNPANFLY